MGAASRTTEQLLRNHGRRGGCGLEERVSAGLEGSSGGTKRVGTPGGVRLCLEGCAENELGLYMEM